MFYTLLQTRHKYVHCIHIFWDDLPMVFGQEKPARNVARNALYRKLGFALCFCPVWGKRRKLNFKLSNFKTFCLCGLCCVFRHMYYVLYVPPPDYCLDSHLIFSNKRDNLILQNVKNNQMITQNKINIQNVFTLYTFVCMNDIQEFIWNTYDSTYTEYMNNFFNVNSQ